MKRSEFYREYGMEILMGAQILQGGIAAHTDEFAQDLDVARFMRSDCLDESEEMVREYLRRMNGDGGDPEIP